MLVPPGAPVAENLAVVTGPILIGIIFNWYLYGVLCVQYLLYLLHSHNDHRSLKFIAHTIFLLDTVQSVFTMEDGFFWFSYHYGDATSLYDFHFVGIDILVIDSIIGLLVQFVYCWGIWRLSRWRVIPLLTALISLLSAACGIAIGVRDYQARSILYIGESFKFPILIWLFGTALTDIAIASSMAYLLLRLQKESSAKIRQTTGKRITRLLTLVLETNAITAAVAIETVVVFFIRSIAPPVTTIYEPGGYVLGKLYSNYFMILLNQRRHQNTSSRSATVLESSIPVSIEFGSVPTPASRSLGTKAISSHIHYLKSKTLSRLHDAENLTRSDQSLSDIEFADTRSNERR